MCKENEKEELERDKGRRDRRMQARRNTRANISHWICPGMPYKVRTWYFSLDDAIQPPDGAAVNAPNSYHDDDQSDRLRSSNRLLMIPL